MPVVATSSTRPSHARGFTLLEVVIVGIVLVLLATMIVPRMSGISRRRNDAAVEAAASVVAAFAFHESTGTRQLALSYSADFRQLELQVLEFDPDDPARRPRWRIHPYSQPVTLPESVDISSITSNGELLDPDDFFIATEAAGNRPSIELRIDADDNSGATIALSPYALSPIVIFDRYENPPTIREPSNLDEMGLEREDW